MFVTDKSQVPELIVPNVHVKHISSAEIARRVIRAVKHSGLSDIQGASNTHHITSNNQSFSKGSHAHVAADDCPSDVKHGSDNNHKDHDLKLLYGALFEDILVDYTHWGLLVFFPLADICLAYNITFEIFKAFQFIDGYCQ